MEVSSTRLSAKLPVKQARTETIKPAKAAATVKKPAVRRKKSTPPAPDAAEITTMIATAAYYLAADRGFAPGRELDDWLEAEKQVLATLA